VENKITPKIRKLDSQSKGLNSSAERKDFLTVGIGASAGGIKPLKEFFTALSDHSGMAFVVILHLSPEHESQLPEVLQPSTRMPVIQVKETVKVEPNHVYVIPPTKHLAMVDGEIRLMEPDTIRGKRVPIDLFFRTLAEAHGKNCVCIVLSGTGADGAIGLKRVKETGGLCIVQDPAQAEYDGMPRSAIATNLVDLVLPVEEMPARILDFKQRAENIKFPESEAEKPAPELGAEALQEVLSIVKTHTKHDFSTYKQPTMLRRIARRLLVHGLADIPAYVQFLGENAGEVQALLRDLLISVTNFFRDKAAFAALESIVVPRLFDGKTADDEVRVWCVGCATGEEAYSIAMLLSEYAATLDAPAKIQIFASDIAESSIAFAREGRYDETIALDVSPERLRHFFTKDGASFRVKKELRELVLFAPHNILHDSPFSRQDLVSCRNLLIYFNRQTQEKVMEVFHFALRQDGYLFLGASEMAETVPAMFAEIDKKQRIYQCRAVPSKYSGAPVSSLTDNLQLKNSESIGGNNEQGFSFNALHFKLIQQFSPPSILINENYDILHLSEAAGQYIRIRGGEPTFNLGKIAHPDLRPDLLAALFAAKQENGVSESRHLRINLEGKEHFVNLTVHRIQSPEAAHGYFLVIFEEISDQSIPAEMLQKFISADEGAEVVIRRLEEDLQFTRDRLRQTVEQHEVSLEEVKASNEELQATNEELRSTTEELETSKEELQSVNEELTTVNFELKEKVEEISNANLDLQNLMASTDISTIFLDCDLQIKRFTSPVQKLFNILLYDVGRPLAHMTHRLEYKNLIADAAEVLRTLQVLEREVKSEVGRWHSVRIIPYRTTDNRIDGVLLTFEDITERRQAKQTLKDAARRKDEFLAILAHELRNPLAPIRNGIQILRRIGNDKRVIEQTLNIVERQTNQIIRLVDDLLDISRITQGKITLKKERIEVKTAIEMAIEASREMIESNHLQFTLSLPDEPVYLEADFTRLTQILLNLLNNAIKYTQPGGKVWLSAEKEAHEVVVKVRDTGIGIAPEMLENIFEMYTQIEDNSSAKLRGGLGIGLNVVKNLIEMHGGTIQAFSRGADKGSEFILRLPLTEEAATVASGQQFAMGDIAHSANLKPLENETSSPLKEKRILVVDDNVDAAEMIYVLLLGEGHEVRKAFDAETGIEIAKAFEPDVCLLDIGLPKMDGYELARHLRGMMPQVKLIALTGWGQPEDRRRSMDAGFNHHLVKPVEIESVRRLVEE
jgi:two-component system, chemotaxis family, CheB/CheR fusion protein